MQQRMFFWLLLFDSIFLSLKLNLWVIVNLVSMKMIVFFCGVSIDLMSEMDIFRGELDDCFRWLWDTSIKVGVTVVVEMDSEGEEDGLSMYFFFFFFYHFSIWTKERVR